MDMKHLVIASRFITALCLAACGTGSPTPASTAVATAGGQQLAARTLADLMGNSRVTLRPEEARTIADLWIDYQLLATAAATGDSLIDPALVDDAIWAQVANARARKWHQRVSSGWPLDTVDAALLYSSGKLLMARQILLDVPTIASPLQRQMIRQSVDSIRAGLTKQNFAATAMKLSTDRNSATDGGLLQPWPAQRGVMVPEFELGVAATPFGTISTPIPTSFGVHIVYRPTYAEAAASVVVLAKQLAAQRAESTYFAGLEKAAAVKLAPDATLLARSISEDLDAYADSASVLATSNAGDFTAARLVQWVSAYPPERGMQGQLRNAPDSVVPLVLREIIRNELFLRQADSAGITLTRAETDVFRAELRTIVGSVTGTLGLVPAMMPDSIRTQGVAARRKFLAARADAAIANMVANRGLVVQIPRPLRRLLRSRYPQASVSKDGIDVALGAARRVRESADSARNATPVNTAPGNAAPGMEPAAAKPATALKPKA